MALEEIAQYDQSLSESIAVFDVDETLYSPKQSILNAPFNGDLKVSPNLLSAILAYKLKKDGVISRERFSKHASQMYGKILAENGSERMQAFYSKVARNEELHHDGAVELLQTFIELDVLLVFITGGHEDFIRTFLQENNVLFSEDQVRILGSTFEKTEDGRGYTGRVLDSNVGAQGKQYVIDALQNVYPGLPIICSAGDDEADVPLTQAVCDDGLRLALDEKLVNKLVSIGYVPMLTIDEYMDYKMPNKVLHLSKKPLPGRQTMADVQRYFKKLLPGNRSAHRESHSSLTNIRLLGS